MLRAMVIDDDIYLNILYSLYLRDHFVCDTASDGAEAVRLFEQAMGADRPYSLVLTDMHMPGMDGLTAIREMRRIEQAWDQGAPPCKIVVATSDGRQRQILSDLDDVRVDGFLLKPCLREHLDEVVRRVGLPVGLPVDGFLSRS